MGGAIKMTKEQFIKKAKKGGLKIHKNNIQKAKPIYRVCGNLSTKHPTSPEKLLDR